MTDILTIVAELIGTVTRVELAFPDISATFPVTTVTEIDNSAEVVLNGADRIDGHVVQLDIWDNSYTPITVNNTAISINGILTAKGFVRISSNLVRDTSGLQRRTSRYRAYIDEITGNVYSRI